MNFLKNNNQNDTMTDLKNLTNTQGQYRFCFFLQYLKVHINIQNKDTYVVGF